MSKLISVIVPVYNVDKYLENCVNTLVNQTYSNLQIILVDDGSTDSSGNICDRLAKEDERIVVVHKDNEGLGMARNTGLDYASGEYVMFVDSDDYTDITMVEKLYNALNNYKADTSYCGYTMAYNSGKQKEIPAYYNNKIFQNEEIIDNVLLEMIAGQPDAKKDAILSMSVWHALYSMKIIKDNNLCFPSEREFISEDIIFDIAYLQKSKCVCYIEDPLYFYRCSNENSLTHQYKKDEFERQKKQIDKMEYELKKFLPEGKFIYRTQRYFLGRYRTCVQKAITESRINKDFNLKEHIKKLTYDSKTQSVIAAYPFRKNPIKIRLFNMCVKVKWVYGIIFLTKLSNIGKDRRF